MWGPPFLSFPVSYFCKLCFYFCISKIEKIAWCSTAIVKFSMLWFCLALQSWKINNKHYFQFSSLSRVWLFATPWIPARQASLSIISSWSSLKLMSMESVMPSSHFILGCPLLLLPPILPSIRVFPQSTLHMRCPKYWSFSFSINPSKEHPGLISFRRDWLDLLAVQGTLKSLPQHHSSKASILQRSAFFTVQLSHPYMTTAKTIALTRWTFVSKVMSLLYNMLSILVITFLPRSKHLLTSCLQLPYAVILEPVSNSFQPHRILQAKILEWIAFSFSMGSTQARDQTQVSSQVNYCRWIIYHKRSPRILEWIAISFSEGSSSLRDVTRVFCIANKFFTV